MKTDEAMLLAQIMLDQTFFHELTIDEECFLRDDTRRVYRAISQCIAKGVKPDLISIRDADPQIEVNRLVQISDMTHSAANWRYYEGKVKTAYKRSKIYQLGQKLSEEAKITEPDDLVAFIETELMKLALDYSSDRVKRLDEYAPDYVNELMLRHKTPGALRGIGSGFAQLDDMTHGFQPRRLYYIGARPSQGKSAIMMNMAAKIGLRDKLSVGIISIESSGYEIIERIFSHEQGIPSDMLAKGQWTDTIFKDLKALGDTIKGRPFYIYDKPNMKLDQVKSVARVMKKVFDTKIIFVDYLQLIRNANPRMEKVATVMETSQAMKELARELDVPIVCLAQLGRDADDRKPGMGDFQWSSQAEQDADFCGLIWHEKDGEAVKTWLLVAKNRDGKKGGIPMRFDGETLTFRELDIH
jgi:replicative DNA helicase